MLLSAIDLRTFIDAINNHRANESKYGWYDKIACQYKFISLIDNKVVNGKQLRMLYRNMKRMFITFDLFFTSTSHREG